MIDSSKIRADAMQFRLIAPGKISEWRARAIEKKGDDNKTTLRLCTNEHDDYVSE